MMKVGRSRPMLPRLLVSPSPCLPVFDPLPAASCLTSASPSLLTTNLADRRRLCYKEAVRRPLTPVQGRWPDEDGGHMPAGLPRPSAPACESPRLAETLESQNWEERCPQPTPILFRGSAFVVSAEMLSGIEVVNIEQGSWSNDGKR